MEKLCEVFAEIEEGKVMITHDKEQEPVMIQVMELIRSSYPELRLSAKKQGSRTSWTIAA